MNSIQTNSFLQPRDAHLLSMIMADQPINGELDDASDSIRRLAGRLLDASVTDRSHILDGYSLSYADPDALLKAIADADPLQPPPEGKPPRRFATCADIDRLRSSIPWAWELWLPAARISGIAAGEGVGKTLLALDLCRRAWNGEPWPDGQIMTFPPESCSIWLAADGQHDELAQALAVRDMPPEAIIFPTDWEDPYGGTSLDDPETLQALDEACRIHRPAFVVVDSLTYATQNDLSEQRVVSKLKDPLVNLAQTHQVVVLLLLHVSKEGQALGRRIKGVTRTLMHLENPDPTKSGKLRFRMEKSYAAKPPALGVTIGDRGNEYDADPPAAPEPHKMGRPPVKLEPCKRWLSDRLTPNPDRVMDIRTAAEKEGYSAGVLYRAKDAMGIEEYVLDGCKWWKIGSDSYTIEDEGGLS